MASTSSVGCSLHATPCYRTEQAMSMVMDSQSLNALAADSGSEKVKVFPQPVVNDLLNRSGADSDFLPDDSDAKHVHSTNCVTSKSNFK